MTEESPNKALHRTAFCAWGFASEFFLFSAIPEAEKFD